MLSACLFNSLSRSIIAVAELTSACIHKQVLPVAESQLQRHSSSFFVVTPRYYLLPFNQYISTYRRCIPNIRKTASRHRDLIATMAKVETKWGKDMEQDAESALTAIDKASLLRELERLCPGVLASFPWSSCVSGLAKCERDDSLHAAIEIGCIRMRRPRPSRTGRSNCMTFEPLMAVDVGASKNALPEVLCYTRGGGERVQQRVKEDGFMPIGVFAQFINCHEDLAVNRALRIDDPVIVSLIQFILVMGGHRQEYVHNEPTGVPVWAQLFSLIGALQIVTRAKKPANDNSISSTPATQEAIRSDLTMQGQQRSEANTQQPHTTAVSNVLNPRKSTSTSPENKVKVEDTTTSTQPD